MSEARRKRWLQFLALVIAAGASLATSKRKGWTLEADVANDAPGKARVVLVESSDEPRVYLDNRQMPRNLGGYYTGLWSGTARYFIPADRKLESISIQGSCGGGCDAGAGCAPPPDAKLRVLSIKPVETWRREVVTPAKTEDLLYEATHFPITASHPIRIELTATGRDGNAWRRDDNRIVIDWHAYPSEPVRTTWSLRVIMEDLCPSAAPCEPPSDAKLELGKETRASR